MQKIIKFGLVSLFCTSLYATEYQYGSGTFKIKGGFIGLTSTQSADVTTYSIVEQHASLFGSKSYFYKYNITFYDSDKIVNGQNNINNNILSTTVIPTIDYRPQGLDVNFVLGKDLYHKNENQYTGLGLMLGVSLPWIDSKKDSNNDDSSSNSSMNNMPDTKTKIYTYKIGPNLNGRISLNNLFSLYGNMTYAYQNGTFKNNDLDVDLTVNGTFTEYEYGIRFQPIYANYHLGWITFSPRFYATIGYRYTNWELKDINIDVTNNNMVFNKTNFTMNSAITYFGIGYSF